MYLVPTPLVVGIIKLTSVIISLTASNDLPSSVRYLFSIGDTQMMQRKYALKWH
ncbi:hypothetical protein [uncultured Catenibacterium sp.]|uniref:hypothetical protein n=1 Tax=uncultured Catenibacterium sp. TaxID=286142 RepID=UPI0025F53156|nr:hypothetical protein [uncultured Catenibacterium sp.]